MYQRTPQLLVLMLAAHVAAAHDIGHEHEHVEGGWNAKAGFVSDTDITAKLWNPRGKSQAEIDKRADFVASSFDGARTAAERTADHEIRDRYKDAIVINMLMPSGIGIQGVNEEKFALALNRNRDAGVDLISTSVWAFTGVNDVSFEDTLRRTDAAIEANGAVKVTSVGEIRQAKASGKLAVIYNSQGADFVIDDMDKVSWAREQGIKILNFTYNNDNGLAGGGQSPNNSGVTARGQEFIERMNTEKLLIDVSHSSDQTAIDAARYSALPVMATHSNVKALYQQGRNLSDDGIRAIAKAGGAVCTVGVGLFLNDEGDASMEAIAEHVQYVGQLVGRNYTCYASDYSYMYSAFLKAFIAQVDKYPPENGFGAPTENAWGGDIWGVAKVLEDKYNWSEDDIRGFLGENVMRVFAAYWD